MRRRSGILWFLTVYLRFGGGGVTLQTLYPWVYDKLSNIICNYDRANLAAMMYSVLVTCMAIN
jgi:hypothetical protein